MALRTEQKLPIILFVVFVTLTTVGVLYYQSTASFQETLEWERKANEAIAAADEIGRLSMNVDRSVFGFAYTGNDSYLEPYTRAQNVIPTSIRKLKELAADDANELQYVLQLESTVGELMAEATRKVEARKMGGPREGMNQITNIMDRPRVEAVQVSVRQLKEVVTQRYQAHDTGTDRGLSRSATVLIASSITGLIGLALANWIVYREIRKRQDAEEELTDANRTLELKVEERTEELLTMNERLIDIGDEREQLLRGEKLARQEAEIATRLREEFMATVSHELRTPLNSILGWARLLKGGTLDHSQTERAVTTIIKNSETQNRLIEDLLDVARIISGKLELAYERVSILDVVNFSIESARPTAAAKGQRLVLEHPSVDQSTAVRGDTDRLRQVFTNLLTNSIKFSPDGTTVTINITADYEFCDIKVVDQGIGISKEFLPLVFERFRQDLNGPGKNGGLGLGLAIVRNLVEMHGGSVGVESEGEGKGSTFTVRLPLLDS